MNIKKTVFSSEKNEKKTSLNSSMVRLGSLVGGTRVVGGKRIIRVMQRSLFPITFTFFCFRRNKGQTRAW